MADRQYLPLGRDNPNDLSEDEDNGEDELSIDGHKAFLRAEWAKDSTERSVGLIKDRMNRTRFNRRTLARTTMPLALVEEYPVMKDFRQVIEEGQRQFRINFSDARIRFFTGTVVATIMRELRSSNSREHKKWMRHINDCPTDKVQEAERHFALMGLPMLCKDKMHFWVVVNENVAVDQPVLQLTTENDRNIFQGNPSMKVFVNKEVLCEALPEDGVTISEGFDALMVASHLFNIQEASSIIGTMRYASEVIYKCKTVRRLTQKMKTLSSIIPSSAV